MKKRVCETCRFFQEAGFAKNGWCNHPQRKESSDVKIVVRRNDLPCRNGWAQDLWTAPAENGDASDIVLHDTVSVRPVQPASVEELTFLVNSQREKSYAPEPPPGNLPVDVVVGEAPSTKPAKERQSLLALDPRAAILKAREQHRARMNAELRQNDPTRQVPVWNADTFTPSAPASSGSYPIQQDQFSPPPRAPRSPRVNDVPPVQLSELPRNFPTITSFPEDELKFSSVPEQISGFALPRPAPPVRAPLKSMAGADHDALDDDRSPRDISSSPTTTSVGSTSIGTDRALGPADSDRRLPRRAVEAEFIVSEGAGDEERFPSPQRRGDQFDRGRSDRTVELPETDVVDEQPSPSTRRETGPTRIAVHIDAPAVYDDLADVDPTIQIAPDVPRMCQTCRDFRPADNGERGWCTNKWAFSHRRMVDSDELPCETSIGCWWLPHDDLWLTTADASAHGQPTPLVDHWLAHKVGAATLDAADGEQRRRRRS